MIFAAMTRCAECPNVSYGVSDVCRSCLSRSRVSFVARERASDARATIGVCVALVVLVAMWWWG